MMAAGRPGSDAPGKDAALCARNGIRPACPCGILQDGQISCRFNGEYRIALTGRLTRTYRSLTFWPGV